jgi:hypothetical protein
MVPAAPPEFITAAATGVNTAPELTVKVPETPKLLFAETAALEASAKPENVRVPELLIELPFPKVMVPPEGENTPLEPTVRAVPTLNEEPVVTVADAAIARVLKASVPELPMEPPLFMVTVPALGERLPDVPTVKAPPTAKLALVVVVPLKVTPLNVSVPELFIEVAPVSKVIVPPVGAKVFPEDIVKLLLILKPAPDWEDGVSEIVNA